MLIVNFQKYKYLLAFLLPLSALIALNANGLWTYATVIFAFGFIPSVELFWHGSKSNLNDADYETAKTSKYYDYLILINVPLLYFIVFSFLQRMTLEELFLFEKVGLCLSIGIIVGAIGINIGHELGHRKSLFMRRMGILQLIPGLYTHFYIEHNRGHHKNVATPLDPATSRYNQPIYTFWIRSTVLSYINAWKLERKRLSHKWFSLKNQMIQMQLLVAIYLLAVGLYFGWEGLIYALIAGVVGFLLLESVNYIEHYGLERKKLPNGRYERVGLQHSWNSNHEMGRIVLYELTRHSHHHYKSTVKYQLLNHHEESPQLPLGYPASILLALVPPLWFRYINPKVKAISTPS